MELNAKRKDASASNPLKQPTRHDFGGIEQVIGNFGRYQLLIFVFKILIGATSAFNNLGVTFFAPSDFISFWCADADATAATSPQRYPNSINNAEPAQLTRVETSSSLLKSDLSYGNILTDFIWNEERQLRHSRPLNYDTPVATRKECYYNSTIDGETHKCTSFHYDSGIWISTIVEEWNLVCDRAWLVSASQSLYMSGFIVSFLVFGYISDRFGRWRSLLFGALIEALSGFACAFAPSISWFLFFRFLLGLGNAGRTTSSYLVMIEWAGPRWRMHISTLGSLGWMMGYSLMPWISLYFLHFRHMQLFICSYELIFIIWLLFLPESPRWLLAHKRFDEAYEVLLKAAKFNGLIIAKDATATDVVEGDSNSNSTTHLSEFYNKRIEGISTDQPDAQHLELRPYTIEQFKVKFKRLVSSIYAKDFTENEDKLSVVDLFRWPNLRKYLFVLFFFWASNSFIYYGIVLRVSDFGAKNLFIAFTAAGLTELPSIAFIILCMKFLPRQTTNLFLFTSVGLMCAIQIPLKYYDLGWLQQATIILAKLFNSCSFSCILYQTMELFPTVIRQTAYSWCSLAGRVGSILAPFVKELSNLTNNSVPPAMYAALSILSVILVTLLPETKGTDLPDTLLEAERFESEQKKAECEAR